MNFVVGLIFIIAVIALLYWLGKRGSAKRQAEAWTGVLEKKWVSSTQSSDEIDSVTRYFYRLKVKLDGTNKKKTVTVQKPLYDSVEAGGQARKEGRGDGSDQGQLTRSIFSESVRT